MNSSPRCGAAWKSATRWSRRRCCGHARRSETPANGSRRSARCRASAIAGSRRCWKFLMRMRLRSRPHGSHPETSRLRNPSDFDRPRVQTLRPRRSQSHSVERHRWFAGLVAARGSRSSRRLGCSSARRSWPAPVRAGESCWCCPSPCRPRHRERTGSDWVRWITSPVACRREWLKVLPSDQAVHLGAQLGDPSDDHVRRLAEAAVRRRRRSVVAPEAQRDGVDGACA